MKETLASQKLFFDKHQQSSGLLEIWVQTSASSHGGSFMSNLASSSVTVSAAGPSACCEEQMKQKDTFTSIRGMCSYLSSGMDGAHTHGVGSYVFPLLCPEWQMGPLFLIFLEKQKIFLSPLCELSTMSKHHISSYRRKPLTPTLVHLGVCHY